jgi:hypothetical protein
MSQPREIAPGATYMITRRVLRRHLLFRPDAAINQLLVYALAVSARRYGVNPTWVGSSAVNVGRVAGRFASLSSETVGFRCARGGKQKSSAAPAPVPRPKR